METKLRKIKNGLYRITDCSDKKFIGKKVVIAIKNKVNCINSFCYYEFDDEGMIWYNGVLIGYWEVL